MKAKNSAQIAEATNVRSTEVLPGGAILAEVQLFDENRKVVGTVSVTATKRHLAITSRTPLTDEQLAQIERTFFTEDAE